MAETPNIADSGKGLTQFVVMNSFQRARTQNKPFACFRFAIESKTR
jgi:hypothetical protein